MNLKKKLKPLILMKDTGLKRVPRGIFALFVFVDANDVSLQIKKNQRGVHSSVVDCISTGHRTMTASDKSHNS
jgi:hypothetical protein